jgi:hypothetical protein
MARWRWPALSICRSPESGLSHRGHVSVHAQVADFALRTKRLAERGDNTHHTPCCRPRSMSQSCRR